MVERPAKLPSRAVLCLWGKLAEREQSCHPLLCHLLDTGETTNAVWNRTGGTLRRVVCEALELPASQCGRWLTFWASLHDLGKATPAFQLKARETHTALVLGLESQGLSLAGANPGIPHGTLGAKVLEDLARGRQLLTEAFPLWVIQAVAGHHGVFPQVRELSHRDTGGHGWQEARREVVLWLARHWGVDMNHPPAVPRGPHQAIGMVLAGLVSVSDWIASCESFFPLVGMGVDMLQYPREAKRRAAAALESIKWGWQPASLDAAAFTRIFGFAPNRLQRAVEDLAGGSEGPGLTIIEAPMGTGKTEAAFWAIREALGQGHQGVYLALPAQATSDQMFRRFAAFAAHLAKGRVGLELLHGQATLNPDFQALRLRQTDADDGLVALEWFASAKRGLLAPLGVGTIDQALLGVLQTRHFFVRLFGLAAKVVVLDEIHAYDTYTSSLIQSLLRYLGAMGCQVVLMSATLPVARRKELLAAYAGGCVSVDQTAYPQITVLRNGQAAVHPVPAEAHHTVELATIPHDPGAMADELAQHLGEGCCACICNTVGRAQQVYQTVHRRFSPLGFEVHLLHARFPAGQRRRIESQLVPQFGKEGWADGSRPAKAIVVATQVIEQSLDLDFDLMVTDVAPVDLVLQRLGRLHRHSGNGRFDTPRPASLAGPRLLIAAPPLSGGLPEFGHDQAVYDRYILLLSYWQLVSSGRGEIQIPDDLPLMVERVYGETPALPDDPVWQAALVQAKADLERERREDCFLAALRAVPAPDAEDLMERFNQELPDDEGWSLGGLTRKGRQCIRLICLHSVNGHTFLDPAGQTPADLDTRPGSDLLVALLEQSVALSHPGVVHHLVKEPVPAGWRKSPLLRHCRPLVFSGGTATVGKLTIRLEQQLGIVYESPMQGAPDGPLVQPS